MDTNNFYALGRKVIDVFYSKGFSDVDIQFETGAENGDGLIGVILHAKVCAVKKDVPQEFDTVVKCAPTSESFRNSMPVRNLFLRETLYYTKIVPIFDNLQDQFELCVPQEMRCLLPKYYGSCVDFRQEMIILEDLTKKGYSVTPLKTLDYNHAALIIKTIAKLHGLSFIYEDRYPKRFREMANQCANDILMPNEEFEDKSLNLHGEKVTKQFLSAITDDTLRERCVKALGTNAYEKFKEITESGKIMAILHGDNWHCNYMFKYKNGKPTDAVPIDFQWARYGSIGYDFMYLFSKSIEGDLRRNQVYQLVDEYYAAFKGFLSLCGYDANRFCSYEEFKEEVKSQALLSIVVFMFANPFFANPGLVLPEMLSTPVYDTVTEVYKQNANEMELNRNKPKLNTLFWRKL